MGAQQRQGARERLAAQEALVKRVKLYSTTLTPFDEHGKPLDPLEAKARLRNAAAGKVKKTIQDRILDPRTNRPEFWADKAEKRAQSLKEKETRKSGGSGSDEPLRLEYKPAELPAGAKGLDGSLHCKNKLKATRKTGEKHKTKLNQ